MEKEVEDAVKRFQSSNDEICLQLQILDLESQFDRQQDIESLLRREKDDTRAEIQSIRDAILPIMTGQSQTMSIIKRAVVVRLSDADKSDITRQVCEALIAHPSALKKSYHNAITLPRRHRQSLRLSRWSSVQVICVCSKNRISWTSQLTPGAGLGSDMKLDHHTACPLANCTRQLWSYTLSVSFLPLVFRTGAIPFGATSHGAVGQYRLPWRSSLQCRGPHLHCFGVLIGCQLLTLAFAKGVLGRHRQRSV